MDSEVKLIADAAAAAAVAPLDARVKAQADDLQKLRAQVARHEQEIGLLLTRVTALEGATPAPPPVVTPPPVVIPPLSVPVPDAALGKVFRKVFSDGTLAPFKVLTYPDLHIGQSGQFMTVFNRFTAGRLPTIHDGYLDLQAIRTADPLLWDADLVGTSQDNNGPTFGYGVFRYWLRFSAGPACWPTAWLYDTTAWSATEIDFPEMLEGLRLTYHVIGQGAGGGQVPLPLDASGVFHEYRVERRAGFMAFAIDGVEKARITAPQPSSKLAILLDAKVGFPWTGSTGQITSATPNPTFLHVAAVTVD